MKETKVKTEWASTSGASGSSTFEMPTCPHKLLCGWCEKLDRDCPKDSITITTPFYPAWWGVVTPYPYKVEITCEDK